MSPHRKVTFFHNAVYSIHYASSHIVRDEEEIRIVEKYLYTIMPESANECSNTIAGQIAAPPVTRCAPPIKK